MKTYLIDYRYDGYSWVTQIEAESLDDAVARFKAIRQTGDVQGELVVKIPASLGFFAKAICWLRNAWS